jgi:hypothetical protein
MKLATFCLVTLLALAGPALAGERLEAKPAPPVPTPEQARSAGMPSTPDPKLNPQPEVPSAKDARLPTAQH